MSVFEELRIRRWNRWLNYRKTFFFTRSIWRHALKRLMGKPQLSAFTAILLAALGHPDSLIRTRALEYLKSCRETVQINYLWKIWAEVRSDVLIDILRSQNKTATGPPEIYLLSRLKFGRIKRIKSADISRTRQLLELLDDEDAQVQNSALSVLGQLENRESNEFLCTRFLEAADGRIGTVLKQTAYLPEDPHQRAALLFLTDRIEHYLEDDFDYRHLRNVFHTAGTALRQRIVDTIRRLGRADMLKIIAGDDFHSRVPQMQSAELEMLIEMLTRQEHWQALWKLVFEVPLRWSVEIVDRLRQQQWRPKAPDQQVLLEKLSELAVRPLVMTLRDVPEEIWWPRRRSLVRVSGRINTVAFSPTEPLIAIGTGNRKVVIWNYKNACREHLLNGFQRSIATAVFSGDGCLVCAERTNKSDKICSIYGWEGQEPFMLGSHVGSVTGLAALGEAQIASCGRDGELVIWDLAKRKVLRRRELPDWPRGICSSADGKRLALLYRTISLLNSKDLEILLSYSVPGSSQQAAFAPDKRSLLAGIPNGEFFYLSTDTENPDGKTIHHYNSSVQGVAGLIRNNMILAAMADGQVEILDWPHRRKINSIRIQGERLTSIHVSPDGSFLAAGNSDASMTLWDIRGLDLPYLLEAPLATTLPAHLTAVQLLLERADEHPKIKDTLQFIDRILKFRFRFAIEIDQPVRLKAGEFDIEID